MFKIRKEQMPAFEQAALNHFENDMAIHLQQFAPKYCEAMGEMKLRSLIQSGVVKARKINHIQIRINHLFLE